LDDVIEQERCNGKFGHVSCSKIEGVLYEYIGKAIHMCNLIVRSCPEYKELFFSLVISMNAKSFTDGGKRSELNMDWILALWDSYNNETDPDLTAILGTETMSYPGGGPVTQSAVIKGFIRSLEDLNKETKKNGSQLILREISEDYDESRNKYWELIERLKNGNISVQAAKQEQVILALLLLDANIASQIYALLGQIGGIRHGPRYTTLDTSFAKDYQELYVEPLNKRSLNVPKLRATINNLRDLISNGMGDEVRRGTLGVSPDTIRLSLTWWVE
jgi:hypothetical protein